MKTIVNRIYLIYKLWFFCVIVYEFVILSILIRSVVCDWVIVFEIVYHCVWVWFCMCDCMRLCVWLCVWLILWLCVTLCVIVCDSVYDYTNTYTHIDTLTYNKKTQLQKQYDTITNTQTWYTQRHKQTHNDIYTQT